jgi:ribosomal RNA assembly protein
MEKRKQKVNLPPQSPQLSITDSYLLQQTETTEKRRAERAEVFVAPVETAAPTVEEKRRHKKRSAMELEVDHEEPEGVEKAKKKKKVKGKPEVEGDS